MQPLAQYVGAKLCNKEARVVSMLLQFFLARSARVTMHEVCLAALPKKILSLLPCATADRSSSPLFEKTSEPHRMKVRIEIKQ